MPGSTSLASDGRPPSSTPRGASDTTTAAAVYVPFERFGDLTGMFAHDAEGDANGGLETLEDLLGEIEVELARLAEQEAPPLVVDEELSAAAAAEAANREAVLRLERLLASASFSHDELRENALALATLGWELPHEPGGALQPPPRQRRLPPPPPPPEEAAERAAERRRQRQLLTPASRRGGGVEP
jgi:hypothetical protein